MDEEGQQLPHVSQGRVDHQQGPVPDTPELHRRPISPTAKEHRSYTKEQIKNIREMGKTAVGAATKIKTLTQLQEALKEEVATAYAAIFKTLFGNITQATALFSKVHTAVENALTIPIYNFNKVLEGWAKLGGRQTLFKGIVDGLHDIESVIKPIKDGFTEIFPPATAKSLMSITTAFADFMKKFKMGAEAANNLKRTFAGLFAVLDIGWQVIKQTIKFIGELFGMVTKGEGSGGFLAATANIGDFLVKLDEMLKKGDGLKKFFNELATIVSKPIEVIKYLADVIFGLFSIKAPAGGLPIGKALTPVEGAIKVITAVFNEFKAIVMGLWTVLGPVIEKIGSLFKSLGKTINDAVGGITFENVLHAVNTGLFAGLVLIIKRFVNHFTHQDSPLKRASSIPSRSRSSS